MILSKNLKFLRKRRGWTQEDFAEHFDVKRSSVGAYEEGRALPKLELLMELSNTFNVSLKQLVEDDLELWKDVDWKSAQSGADLTGTNLRVLAISTDQSDNENVVFVNVKARAGYLAGYADPVYVNELPRFQLPFLPKDSSYRAFEIEGDSMLPIQEGSIIIAEYVEDWSALKDGESYIVLSREDGVVFKRVFKQIEEENSIILQSDNASYPPYTVDMSEVLEIWKAKLCISNINIKKQLQADNMLQLVKDLQKDVARLKNKLD